MDRWPLNLPLVHFSRLRADFWTLADACQGVLIQGENGSGKTSGSGQIFAKKYLENGFGGLVLCFKTDEADLWRSYPSSLQFPGLGGEDERSRFRREPGHAAGRYSEHPETD